MSIGFGKTTNNQKSIIKSLKKSYLLSDSQYLDYMRSEWNQHFPKRIHHKFREEELFKPLPYIHKEIKNPSHSILNLDQSNNDLQKTQRTTEVIYSGYWGLQVTHDMRGKNSCHYQEWDFSIVVFSGNCYTIHPSIGSTVSTMPSAEE